MTGSDQRWRDAPDASQAFLERATTGSDVAGHYLRPLPDKVHVLHPLLERVDGAPVQEGDGADELRPLTWQEYARRRGVPLVRGRAWADVYRVVAGAFADEMVVPPTEGTIDDRGTRTALYETLIEHSGSAPDVPCTAWWYEFYVFDDGDRDPPPANVMRGPLGSWAELYDREDRALGPQTLWPDDERWVLATHTDSWATAVSGPVELVDALLAHPSLEAVRLPWLA